VSGCARYNLQVTSTFESWLKRLLDVHYFDDAIGRSRFTTFLDQAFRQLESNPRKIVGAKPEPWPPGRRSSMHGLEFYKLYFSMPRLTASARQGRLMYLVHERECLVYLVWIYTHADFNTRPPDKDLKPLLADLRSRAFLELASEPLVLDIKGLGRVELTTKINRNST